MARITWLPREDSGPNSAISASTFNEISSSISFLYDQLEDIINFSGSVGSETKAARGGATNYITPIAVYDPNNISNFLDFSSGKFDFRGGDVDIRKGLIDYPLLKRKVEVYIDDNDIKKLEDMIVEIKEIKNSEIVPCVSKMKICSKCSYHDICFI